MIPTYNDKHIKNHDFKHEYQCRKKIIELLDYDILVDRNEDERARDLIISKVNTKNHKTEKLFYIECEKADQSYWLRGRFSPKFDPINFYKKKVYSYDYYGNEFHDYPYQDDKPCIYLRTSHILDNCIAILTTKIHEQSVCKMLNKYKYERDDAVCQVAYNNPNIYMGWDGLLMLMNQLINHENTLF